MSDNSSLSFLPWLRSGLGVISEAQDDGKVRRKAAVTVDLVDENRNSQLEEKHTQSFILKGPGEVLGFSPLMVARTEPCNRENDFEPNYFPYVEFIDPDFPWRYSLDDNLDDNKEKLIPWIMLVVLKKDEFTITSKAKDKILKIEVKQKNVKFPLPELEQLKQSWAWAHVQLSGNIPKNKQLDKYIEENPGLHCSRLMCPRKLEEFTLYSAFVVPTYEIGRRAGLGMNVIKAEDYTPDNSLWKPSASEDDSFELPIYYMWQFQTSESGDFEELIDLIKCKEVPKDENKEYLVGIRKIDGSDPGFIQWTSDGNIFKLEGALVPPGFIRNKENTEDTEKREPIESAGFVKCICPELNKSLKEAPVHKDEDNDPLISIPVYGRYFQRTEKIELPDRKGKWKTSQSWIHENNLDRRYRVTASMGTTIVQENQEEYMKECWEQVGEIKEANENLRLCAAGKFISDSLKERHINPLSDERFTLITQPFHHYYIQKKGKMQQSFKASFKTSGLPQGSISQPFKRIISQKVGFERQKLLDPWKLASQNRIFWRVILRIVLYVVRLLLEGLRIIIEQPDWFKRFILHLKKFCERKIPEDDGNVFRRIYRVILIVLRLALKGIDLIITSPNRLKRWVPALIKILYLIKIPAPNEEPRLPDKDNVLATILDEELGISHKLQDIYPLKSEVVHVTPIDIKKSLRPQFNIKADLLQRINSTIKIPWKDKLISFDPIMKAPKIKLPMYKHLSSRSVDLMIPGLGKLERNTLVLLEENRKFIESYMVGLNHEMGRELVWREFPTDQRGTIFSYFWDSTQSKNPPADIKEIHEWNKKLGKNRIEQKNMVENRLVLAIKADLIRRYPNTIIFAIKKEKNTGWDEVFSKIDKDDSKGNNSFSVCHPIFSANIGVDVLFLGFPFSEKDIQDATKRKYEYYFVFMEHPSLPRFGLDENGSSNLDKNWDNLSWDNFEMGEDKNFIWLNATELKEGVCQEPSKPIWGANSASTAWITFQKPVRIVFPAKELLEKSQNE